MPYTKRRKTRARRKTGLATRARMVPRGLAMKRHFQVSTDVKYFKVCQTLVIDDTGTSFFSWRTQDIVDNPPSGFNYMKELYDQYKCLGIQVKLFPANVGTEGAPNPQGSFRRGDCVIWSDQREEATALAPTSIEEILSDGSAKIINARRPYKRSIFRSRGYPSWGSTQNLSTEPDPWGGAIYLYQDKCAPIPIPPQRGTQLWYCTLLYKILFRGRRTAPP